MDRGKTRTTPYLIIRLTEMMCVVRVFGAYYITESYPIFSQLNWNMLHENLER